MSAIVAVMAPGATDATVGRMLDASGRRGGEHRTIAVVSGAALGVARHGWETTATPAGPAQVVCEGALSAVADATLYYGDELREAIARAGGRVGGDSAAHLALAAYRTWGVDGLDRLEGDFAVALWDATTRRLVCARDFGGKRPLFHARWPHGVAVASTVEALLAHPECPRDLDVAAIASEAAGLYAACEQTAYRAVRAVPAGGCIVADESGSRCHRWSSHLEAEPSVTLSFDDAADRLHALLAQATRERVPREGAAMWLSGGWDSTAVYGAHRSGAAASGAPLHAVTLSYPEGDPGREDELVEQVLARWGDTPHWVPVSEVAVLSESVEAARSRAEPFAHAFEGGNRALARTSRTLGVRVALDGVGGDQLFQVSPVHLADLCRAGRLVDVVRRWRRLGLGRGGRRDAARDAWRWLVRPLLAPGAIERLDRLRGRPLPPGHLERPLPSWFDPAFARRHALLERERAHAPASPSRSPAQREAHWYLRHPFFPRAFSAVAGFALEHGVELRSPLFDRRVVRFALGRPIDERNDGVETKRLLRRAMRGVLPDEVLAPRARRTGVSAPWFVRELRTTHAPFIERVAGRSWQLEELGAIDARAFRRSWELFRGGGGEGLGLQLYLTLQTELWLRSRDVVMSSHG